MCELDEILALKELGNKQLDEQKLDLAIGTYQQALTQIKQISKSQLGKEKRKKLNELKADCYYNIAICYIKQQQIALFQENILKSFNLNTIIGDMEKRINDVVLLFNVLIKNDNTTALRRYLSELNLEGIADTFFASHNAFLEATEGNIKQACQFYAKKREGEMSEQEVVEAVFEHVYPGNSW